MTNTSFVTPLFKAAAFVVALFAATFVSAATWTIDPVSYVATITDNTTIGGPTWNRVDADTSLPSSSWQLSSHGTAVAYDVIPFRVTASATYRFVNTAPGWDNYTFLYQSSFNPAAQTTNLLAGNDDLLSLCTATSGTCESGFDHRLSVGTDYYFVTTGYENDSDGAYTLVITPDYDDTHGSAVPIPEPGSLVLLGLGLVGLASCRRRTRA